jgi:hypothetical protein
LKYPGANIKVVEIDDAGIAKDVSFQKAKKQKEWRDTP